MRCRYIYSVLIFLVITAVIGYIYLPKIFQRTEDLSKTFTAIEAIRAFIGDQNIELVYHNTQPPSNFAVGYNETLSGGDGRMIIPEDWKRQVDVYEQTNLTRDCQIYTYEVDTRTNKVVQVQLVQNFPVGSNMEYKSSQCLKNISPDTIIDSEAEKLAWTYARKNVTDLSQTKAKVSFDKDKSDRYLWMWQDTAYKLPDTLKSEPWPHPTIRIILDKRGHLVTYLNTTFFFYASSL